MWKNMETNYFAVFVQDLLFVLVELENQIHRIFHIGM